MGLADRRARDVVAVALCACNVHSGEQQTEGPETLWLQVQRGSQRLTLRQQSLPGANGATLADNGTASTLDMGHLFGFLRGGTEVLTSGYSLIKQTPTQP